MQDESTLPARLVAFAASLETALQADAGRLTPAARLALASIGASARHLAGLAGPASALASGKSDAPAFFAAVAGQLAEPGFGSLGLGDVLRGLADIEAGRTADADAALATIQGRRAGEAAS